MLIALRFNLSVDYNIELPHHKAKTSTAATSKAEASSSFKGFGFFKTLNTTWFNNNSCRNPKQFIRFLFVLTPNECKSVKIPMTVYIRVNATSH